MGKMFTVGKSVHRQSIATVATWQLKTSQENEGECEGMKFFRTPNTGSSTKALTKESRITRARIRESAGLYVIMLPSLLLIFIFMYIPMYGILISFQNYTPGRPFFAFDGSTTWVGLQHFRTFISSMFFGRIILMFHVR